MSDMEKWDDAALIDAVRQGIDDLRTSDAGAAAAAQTEHVDAAADAEAAADADEEDGGGGSESDGDMAAADARFASLLRVGGGAAAPRSAIAPVRDPSVGEYGDWHPVAAPAAPAAPGPNGQAQPPKLPESLQLLPLYTMALLKSAAFRGGADVRADERSYVLQKLDNMSPDQTRYFVYPRLFALHQLPAEAGKRSASAFAFPPPANLSAESVSSDGVYLLDDSLALAVWVGAAANPQLLEALFALDEAGEVALKPDPRDDSLLGRAWGIVEKLRETRPPTLAISVCREGDPTKQPAFFRHLVEDHANFAGGQFSYQEFMAHIQRHA